MTAFSRQNALARFMLRDAALASLLKVSVPGSQRPVSGLARSISVIMNLYCAPFALKWQSATKARYLSPSSGGTLHGLFEPSGVGAVVGFVGFLAFATDMMMTFADKPTTVVALDFCVRLMARLLSCSGADILRLLVHISARKGSGPPSPKGGPFLYAAFPNFQLSAQRRGEGFAESPDG
jgi:hypothetical protein